MTIRVISSREKERIFPRGEKCLDPLFRVGDSIKQLKKMPGEVQDSTWGLFGFRSSGSNATRCQTFERTGARGI